MRRLLALIPGVSIVLLGGFLRVAAAEPPRIVVSIAPLHSLVAAVSAGVTTPTLLVRGAGSPHGHTMRPSDARSLQEADLVIWIGPILEPFLDRALRDPIDRRRVITLLNEDTITVLPARTTDHADDDHSHDDASGATADPHLWLDPANATAIVALTARTLAKIDPANKSIYRANAARLTQRLVALDAALSQSLAPIAAAPFVVLHDAYQYLEHAYPLHVAGIIAVSPDRKPGARRLRDIQGRIAATGARCVFAEPQFNRDVTTTVVAGTPARVATLDPLGATTPPGPDLYFDMMRQLATALRRCLDET